MPKSFKSTVSISRWVSIDTLNSMSSKKQSKGCDAREFGTTLQSQRNRRIAESNRNESRIWIWWGTVSTATPKSNDKHLKDRKYWLKSALQHESVQNRTQNTTAMIFLQQSVMRFWYLYHNTINFRIEFDRIPFSFRTLSGKIFHNSFFDLYRHRR